MSTIPFGDFIELVFKLGVRPDRPDEDEGRQMSDDIWALAERCWAKDPKARPTATQIHDTINIILRDIHDSTDVRAHAEVPQDLDLGHVQSRNRVQAEVKGVLGAHAEVPQNSSLSPGTHLPSGPDVGHMQSRNRVQAEVKGLKPNESDIRTVKVRL
jgi:hypothetical protein